TRESLAEALDLLQEAVKLDPDFALGYAMQAACYVGRRSNAWDVDRAQEAVEAERVARLALSLDRNDARVLAFAGITLRYIARRFEEGFALLDQAVRLDANNAWGWTWLAGAKFSAGQPEAAIKDLERALRLSPIDTMGFIPQGTMATCLYLCGRYDEA